MSNRYNFPFDWKIPTLDEISILITDGAHYSPSPQDEGELIANVKDMRENHIEYDTCTKIPAKDFHLLSRQNCSPRKDDILLSKDGTIGKVVLFCGDRDIVLLSSIAIIRLSDISSPAFVKHVLKSFLFDLQLFALKSGSALSRIVLSDIRKLTIPCPPLPQQQKIAKILTTVDNLIEQTQALIDKYTAIKQGMMADLFTRGLDITGTPETNPRYGQLRPSVEDAPELYKETELGWVPKEWRVLAIRDVALKVTDGDHHTPQRSEDGILLLSARNIHNGFLDLSNVDYVPKHEYERMIKRCHPEAGDILISCSGTIGRVCEVPVDFIFSLVRSVALVKLDPVMILSRYMEWFLRSERSQRAMFDSSLQAAQPNLFQSAIQSLPILLPPVREQGEIVKRLDELELLTNLERREGNSYEKVKKGLMQDLLTGKVPVKA